MSLEYRFAFPLPNGLHARPASCIEEEVSRFASSVFLLNHRNNRRGDARSILSLVSADFRFEDASTLQVSGEDEETAFASLKTYLTNEFPQCDEDLPAPSPSAEGEAAFPPSLRVEKFPCFRGTPVVPGLGRGRLTRVGGNAFRPELRNLPPLPPAQEIERVTRGLKSLEARIESSLARNGSRDVQSGILKAHRSIAHDRELREKILEIIDTRHCSAAEAVIEAAGHFAAVLQASENPLLHERVLDIQDVCQQLLEQIYGEAARPPRTTLTADSIGIADTLTPSEFLALDRRFLRGLVLGRQGTTSHAAILARSFGVPILAGIELSDGSAGMEREAILDANLGILLTDLTPTVDRYYRQEERRFARRAQRLARSTRRKAATADGKQVCIAANVSDPAELDTPAFQSAEAVGLYRTEMLFLDRKSPPGENEQTETYRTMLEKAGERPVTIRTLDIGGDKPLQYLHIPKEENPFLGYRAVRMYPEYQDILLTQFRALLRGSVAGQLKIMIPMVACVEEVRWAKDLLARARAECERDGFATAASIPFGMMLEVPSAAFLIDHLAPEVDFFSLGTNDLAQYFMAAERGNKRVAHLFDPLQPSFLRFLRMIVDAIHAQGKRVGMCGEMAGSPAALPVLVGLGVDDLSMAIPGLMETKHALAGLDSVACGALTGQALQCRTVEEVHALLNNAPVTEHRHPLLERDLIVLDADCRTPEEVVKELVDGLYVTGRTDRPTEVEEEIWRREAIYSTALGHGFAVPHCKTATMNANSIALLKLKEPVPWKSAEPKPVDVAILLAMREADEDNTHMKVFARLARKIMHDEFRNSLREENDPERLLLFLKETLELE